MWFLTLFLSSSVNLPGAYLVRLSVIEVSQALFLLIRISNRSLPTADISMYGDLHTGTRSLVPLGTEYQIVAW
jgi:hypothetical protein